MGTISGPRDRPGGAATAGRLDVFLVAVLLACGAAEANDAHEEGTGEPIAGLRPIPDAPQRRGGPEPPRGAAIAHIGSPSGRAAGPASAPVSQRPPCGPDEDTFLALKLTRIDGAIRVDYEFAASGTKSWTNMDSALVRRFRVKAGQTFCIGRDAGPVEALNVDFD